MLAGIKEHVEQLFNTYTKPWLLYHNLAHTQQVVQHAEEIAAYYLLEEDILFVLLAAAWFHDTGQLLGDMATHEESGVQIMRSYLSDQQVDEKIQDEIAQCILATKMPVKPVTLIEKILCDADTYHLGTQDFIIMDKLVWQELELRLARTFDKHAEHTLHFLEAHTFYTAYCQQLLNEGKHQNMQQLKRIMAGSS